RTMQQGFDRRRSLEIGRGRVVTLRERLAVHPCDQNDLTDLVPDRKSLSRILAKMVKRRRCYQTSVQLFGVTGNPRRIYCLRKVNTPEHDNAMTKVALALASPTCERGKGVTPVN